jgi:hypothetical protein
MTYKQRVIGAALSILIIPILIAFGMMLLGSPPPAVVLAENTVKRRTYKVTLYNSTGDIRTWTGAYYFQDTPGRLYYFFTKEGKRVQVSGTAITVEEEDQ